MTNNEMKEMLERQLVRLEEMSKKTTSSKALSGLSSSMLAVAVRLDRMRICGEEMIQAEKSLIQAREEARKRFETIGARCGRDDPSYRSAEEVYSSIDKAIFKLRAAVHAIAEEGKGDVVRIYDMV